MGSDAAALDSSAARANVAASQNYEIPAGPVALALNRLADKRGAQLVYDAGLTRKIKTGGLKGRHTLDEALNKLLSGTGLDYRLAPNGSTVAIMLAQNDTTTQTGAGAIALPEVEVTANEEEGPGNLRRRRRARRPVHRICCRCRSTGGGDERQHADPADAAQYPGRVARGYRRSAGDQRPGCNRRQCQ